jgi:hypothetical protein
MTTATALVPVSPLTVTQFQYLADVPPEIEWFANLTNANTRRVCLSKGGSPWSDITTR